MEEQIKTAPQTDVEVVDIQFRSGQKIYFFDPDGQRFADGDHIIIDSSIAKIDIIIKLTPPGVKNSVSAWAGITKSRRRMW